MNLPLPNLSQLNWMEERDLSDPSRPVASATAVVGGDAGTGRIDFYTKWEPNSYCSFHKHTGDAVSVVLAGELHVEELDGTRKVRSVGNYAFTPEGRVHWESAGPGGAVLFFSLHSKDGGAFEHHSREGEVLSSITVAGMLTQFM